MLRDEAAEENRQFFLPETVRCLCKVVYDSRENGPLSHVLGFEATTPAVNVGGTRGHVCESGMGAITCQNLIILFGQALTSVHR